MSFIVKRKSIYEFLIIICVVVDGQFLSIFPGLTSAISSIYGMYNKTIIALLAIIMGVTVLLSKGFYARYVQKNTKVVNRLYLVLLLGIIVNWIYAVIVYNESFSKILAETRHYFILLLFYPILYILLYNKGIENIVKIIFLGGMLNLIIVAIQCFGNYYNGSYVFSDVYSFGLRGDFLRLSVGSLFAFMIIYLTYKITTLKKKLALNLICLLGLLVLFWIIDQGRAGLIYLIVTIVAMILFSTGMTKRKLILFILLVAIAMYVLFAGIASDFINSFSLRGDWGSSTESRLMSFPYYFGKFLENPLVGIGVISDAYSNLNTIRLGPLLSYHPSDVGFIGLLGERGIIFGIFYVLIIVRMGYILRKIHNNSQYENLLIGLFVYSIISSITLSLLNWSFILLLPFMMAIFEYAYIMVKEKMLRY